MTITLSLSRLFVIPAEREHIAIVECDLVGVWVF